MRACILGRRRRHRLRVAAGRTADELASLGGGLRLLGIQLRLGLRLRVGAGCRALDVAGRGRRIRRCAGAGPQPLGDLEAGLGERLRQGDLALWRRASSPRARAAP